MTHQITTQKALRAAFWEENEDLKRRPGWTQNDYPSDTRARWVEFVDALARTGTISEALADRATL